MVYHMSTIYALTTLKPFLANSDSTTLNLSVI